MQGALDGTDIYARVLENRFASFVQECALESADRAGRTRITRLQIHWKDFRDDQDRPVGGVVSKALIEYTHPFDLRHSGYLFIQNHARPSDQFVYLASRRQTRRVNLRGEAVLGTDFSFEDVIPREIEDAHYERIDDGHHAGRSVFRVQAVPSEQFDSSYSRFLFYVDPQRFVPLRTRYWDRAGVEVKELRAEPDTLRELDGVWVPMTLTMRNLLTESQTVLRVEELIPNPDLSQNVFDLRRLEGH